MVQVPSLFMVRSDRSLDELCRVVRSYLEWNGISVATHANRPGNSDEGAILGLIERSDVFLVLQKGELGDAWSVRQFEHALSAGKRIVRVAVADDRQANDGVDVTLHSVEPSVSALRSLWSVIVSEPVAPDQEFADLKVSDADWHALVEGARSAAGIMGSSSSSPQPEGQSWSGGTLREWCDGIAEPVERSVARCAVLTALLRGMRRNQDGAGQPSDARPLWTFVRAAVDCSFRRAQVSSQGFYCVPLFSVVRQGQIEELLRLHIWPANGAAAEEETGGAFSVHSHQPHATSWVLTGGLHNRVHRVRQWPVATTRSQRLFAVSWDGRRSYSVAHRQSSLRDTGVPVSVVLDHEAMFTAGHSYTVPAGQFHETGRMDSSPVVTLFYFDARIGWFENAGVVGPTAAHVPVAKAKETVDVAPLLREIDLGD
ncbi:hypothetical protein ACFWN2_04215 [Lentzea sp. NPDC058436]|uniref:hypothetical protein n=1 Tax=Lentzea sp. NPDC058436 TaxID=3346499 RepID=UPI00364ADEC9